MQHSDELFRKEAIEGQGKNKLGEAMLLPKTNHQILATVLVCWFLLLCGLLINANFSSKATVSGWLVSSKASIDIMAKEPTGIVKSIKISNEQQVTKGQVLVQISRITGAQIGENYQAQLNSLLQQNELLKQRQLILHNKYRQQNKQSETLIQTFKQHLQMNAQVQQKLEEQLKDAIVEEAVLFSLLQNNNISKTSYHAQKEKRQAVELQLAANHSSKVEFEQKRQSVEQSKIANHIASQEEQNTLESNLQSINQEIKRFEGGSDYLLKSPIDGIVHNLQASVGETVGSNKPLLQITPLNNPLQAVLFVPSDHAGFIQNKQLVQLKLTAFPFQKFGMPTARVSQVSQKILLPQQIKRAPVPLYTPVFVVEAALINQQINVNGETLNLKAGMLFQADIILSKRSLLEWLLSPIFSLRGEL